jgi:hypothetical protein
VKATRAAGYSGTPLAKKLGYADGFVVVVNGAPAGIKASLGPLPAVRFANKVGTATDIAHTFVTQRSDLATQLAKLRSQLRDDAVAWVSWPKKAAKMVTDITEDVVRTVALPLGFVDVKVCAVDDSWSGLKLVLRKELRKKEPR